MDGASDGITLELTLKPKRHQVDGNDDEEDEEDFDEDNEDEDEDDDGDIIAAAKVRFVLF